MRILKIHFLAQFQTDHISETACAKKVKFFANRFFLLCSTNPHAKFGEDSRRWVDSLSN